MDNQHRPSHSQPLNEQHGGSRQPIRQKSLVAKAKQKYQPGIKFGLLLALLVSVALIVVGSVGVKKCPVEDNIPLFLIATGVVGLISKFLSYIRERIGPHLDVKYIETALYSVEIVFFILGSYWVYKIYPPKYEPENGQPYCNKVVYMFAFVYISIVYTVLAAIFSAFAFFLVCLCFLTTIEESNDFVDAEAQLDPEPSRNEQETV